MSNALLFVLRLLQRAVEWLEEYTGEDVYGQYVRVVEDLHDGDQAHVNMLAAAYYEKTRLDPEEAALSVVRWKDEDGKYHKEYSFVSLGE